MHALFLVLGFLLTATAIVRAEDSLPVIDPPAALEAGIEEPATVVAETVPEPVPESIPVPAVLPEVVEPVKKEVVTKRVIVKKTVPAGAKSVSGKVGFFNARGTMVFVDVAGTGRVRFLISDKTNIYVDQSPATITGIKIGDEVDVDYLENAGQNTAVNISLGQ